MKERLTNNLGLKVLAIFLAFFVWLIVSNVSNPLVTRSKEVPLEILNEWILSDNNMTYQVIGKNTVTVSYEVNTLDEHKISPGDFRAYADISELFDVTGSIPVKVEVVNNKTLIKGDPNTRPGVIRIKTDVIQKKRFDLQTHINGIPEDGYALGMVSMLPDYVHVTAASSVIGAINTVGIEIDVEGKSADFTGKAVPAFYDGNGNKLNLEDNVSLDTAEISYQVPILKVKNLGLDFQVGGTVAPGYRFTGVDCDIKSVSVEGMKSTLASLNRLTVPTELLDIGGATKDVVVKVDLSELLPEGVTLARTDTVTATITLKVEPLVTKGFKISSEDILLTGASKDYDYRIGTELLQVNIQGLEDDLDALKEKELKPTVDVTGLGPGDYPGVIQLELGEGFRMVNHESFEISIALKESTADETSTPAASAVDPSQSSDEAAKETVSKETVSKETASKETVSKETEIVAE